MNVLVAYGSKNGSTAGIADMIVAALQAEGLVAQARPAADVRSVDEYDVVVLGGALYAGRWHRDARVFARRHIKALLGRPVWLFSSGPLDDSADIGEIPPVAQVAKVLERLGAVEHVTFGGRLTEDAGGFIAKSIVRNGKGGDFRNQERIADWVHTIAARLRAGTPAAK
ncbi:menaquinone-dependent protoporphyrinogen oxidase [Kribbella sp. VKM Ac-2571]|uniref:flavodoxin domain-containing protein n=1 Tax=Kribbella sp. VKM Ac-2571 TaxID=2512222 RepID=UPI00105E7CBF|nr:flavodoxin domain-containing protein [Kribbella sp. VKM Ac-2571]TDO69176.1 menaquinone-dependent protoporphyrinogen oxidase [Kribbella sp. VKM Ac-2571]